MPKYLVEVTRTVKQYRTIVVDAEDETQIDNCAEAVFDCAEDLDLWLGNEVDPDSGKIAVVETTDDEPDLRL